MFALDSSVSGGTSLKPSSNVSVGRVKLNSDRYAKAWENSPRSPSGLTSCEDRVPNSKVLGSGGRRKFNSGRCVKFCKEEWLGRTSDLSVSGDIKSNFDRFSDRLKSSSRRCANA